MVTETILEFGIKRENEERRDGGCGIIFDPETRKFAVGKKHENGSFCLFSGGVDLSEDMQAGIVREVTEESGLYDFSHVEKIGKAITHYYNTLRKVNRVAHATCLLIILNSRKLKAVKLEEHEKFELAWATADEVLNDFQSRNQNKDNDHWIYFFKIALERLKQLEMHAG